MRLTHSSAPRSRRVNQRPKRLTAAAFRHKAAKVMPPIERMSRNRAEWISLPDTATPTSQSMGLSVWKTARRGSPWYSYSSEPSWRRIISVTKS
jgi:hypothetical protein